VKRSPLAIIVGIVVGVIVVIGVTALIGNRDESGETVTAGQWAQNVCGSVGVWRGELESIVEDLRSPSSLLTVGEEPQSETPQGRTGFIRVGLERSVQAAETLVEGVDNAGTPDTPEGPGAAAQVSDWADSAQSDLEDAQDALDDEADSLEQSIEQLTGSAQAIGAVLTSGVQTLTDVAALDPELGAALRTSSTCEQVREETRR
jgi:hypothetical protein